MSLINTLRTSASRLTRVAAGSALGAVFAGDAITVDFAGSSPQSRMGINVVAAYTHAYATFAVRSTTSRCSHSRLSMRL